MPVMDFISISIGMNNEGNETIFGNIEKFVQGEADRIINLQLEDKPYD